MTNLAFSEIENFYVSVEYWMDHKCQDHPIFSRIRKPRVNGVVQGGFEDDSKGDSIFPDWYKPRFKDIDREKMSDAILACDFNSMAPRSVDLMVSDLQGNSLQDAGNFSHAFASLIRSPSCAGTMAYVAMDCLRQVDDTDTWDELNRVLTLLREKEGCPFRSGFFISGQEFRIGLFKSDPFEANEILALPYLSGAFSAIYSNVETNFEQYRDSVSRKLHAAGFTSCALQIKNTEPGEQMVAR